MESFYCLSLRKAHAALIWFSMKKILIPFILVAIIWIVFALQSIGFNLGQFGIYPRHTSGLVGIVASPFLHGSLAHIVSNTLPLLVLSVLLFLFYPKLAIRVIIFSMLIGGILVWLFARSAFHIGASGLIFSLLGFILASGIFRKNAMSIIIAIIVFFIYGGVIWGVLPSDPNVSFEGHLFGFIAGCFLAYTYRNTAMKKPKRLTTA